VAGLVIHDYQGEPLYDARPRDALFASFDDVPAPIVSTLLFLENRELTNPTGPGSNPAIDWGRLGKASGLYVARGVGLPVRSEGGSTLAVQIEKYRCGIGSWGGQRLRMAHYVTGMGPMDGATAAEGRSCCLSSRYFSQSFPFEPATSASGHF
jgi:hypothetical protein